MKLRLEQGPLMDYVSIINGFVSAVSGGGGVTATSGGIGGVGAAGVSGGIGTAAGALTSGALAAGALSGGPSAVQPIEKTEITADTSGQKGRRKKGIQSTILAGADSGSTLQSGGGNTLLGGG